jgi:hypothetical protein
MVEIGMQLSPDEKNPLLSATFIFCQCLLLTKGGRYETSSEENYPRRSAIGCPSPDRSLLSPRKKETQTQTLRPRPL